MSTDANRGPVAGDTLVKRALAEIRELRAKVERSDRARREPIAIIGVGCRFPGASTPDEFWRRMRDGHDAIREIPADRWDIDAYFDADPEAAGKMYTRWGGFLDGVDQFDPRFFGVNPREAATMDPQQRMLLEVAWESLEHAAQAPERLKGQPVGVFVGLAASDYLQLQLRGVEAEAIDAYLASGSSPAVASGRLSYLLGLNGPSLTVDTACSSSLVAVHLACQSLRSRECRMALAGGVSLILLPELYINFSRARMMAADGRCKTFDAAADGYVRGEGCGVAVLKRLSDAVADGDRILAVIRGSAVNQDGRSSGLTVPNGPAQEAVIREALERAGAKPADVSYVEAHGTGTSLGDPIEVRALGAVYREGRAANQPLNLGSVKTNIGHLEAAAGIAGLIKVVLALQQEQIPPHLHLRELNPLIEWRDLPVAVPTTLTPWSSSAGPRLAGLSSFGFSGTNAHVIIGEAPSPAAGANESAVAPASHVLPLSATSPEALQALAGRMVEHLDQDRSASLADVCFTASVGRSHFPHRLAIASDSLETVRTALRGYARGETSGVAHGVHLASSAPEIAFLFTGQGSQYFGMGARLYEAEPVFRAALDRCAEILRPHVDRPLLSIMFGDGDRAPIGETIYAQPALFALEYALVELWRSWGVTPSGVAGHSLGEDVAACVAGVFSLEDGLPLIARRGRLMQDLPGDGEMVAVFAGEDQARRAIERYQGRVSVAAINGPAHVTLSGDAGAVREIVAALQREGVKVRPVSGPRAFHSPLMDPMLDAFERAAAEITYGRPTVPMASGVTGSMATDRELSDPKYWRRHIRETVRFDSAVKTLWDRGCRVFVEIGPAPVLLGMSERTLPAGAAFFSSLRPGREDGDEMRTSAAGLYAAGVNIKWDALHHGSTRRRLALPTYPFQRARYWAVESTGPKPVPEPVRESCWGAATDAAARQAVEGPLDLALPTYPAKWQRLDDLAVAYVIDALRRFGVFTAAGERHDAAVLRNALGILPMYDGLIRRWLETLATRGYLLLDDGQFVAPGPLRGEDPQALLAASTALFADFPAPLEYLSRCGSRLVDLLLGRESALEMLFPNGSTEIADGLYSTSPLARYSNAIARSAIVAAAARATADRPLRILEIGAGTGGTTAGLLPVLPAAATQYCFTDVGPLFLGKAQDRFSAYPFVTYRVLDIERHPREQGFEPHACDVIVAANVLHATRNLHDTLDHVAWLLAPGGLLALCEATRHPFWFDVTTGLIGGWQRFADDLRHDVPLIPPATWQRGLLQHGFTAVHAYPEPDSPAEILGQHVILAAASQDIADREGADVRGAADVKHQPAVAARQFSGGPDPQRGVSSPDARTPSPVTVEGGASERERLAALSQPERHDALVGLVRNAVVQVLRLDASRPPHREQRLMDFGVDSLMAVELRNVLTRALTLPKKLPATLVFDHPTVDAIARYLATAVFDESQAGVVREDAATARQAAERQSGAAAIDGLDDAAVEALLNSSLEKL